MSEINIETPIRRRRQRSDAGTGLKQRALKAVLSGYCNTSRDVADELGVPIEKCQPYVSELKRAGIIRNTDRRIPNISSDGRGPMNKVFEVVNA